MYLSDRALISPGGITELFAIELFLIAASGPWLN